MNERARLSKLYAGAVILGALLVATMVSARAAASPKCFTPWDAPVAVSDDGEYLMFAEGDATARYCGLSQIVETDDLQRVSGVDFGDIYRAIKEREACEDRADDDCGGPCLPYAVANLLAERETPLAGVEFVPLQKLKRLGTYDLSGDGQYPPTNRSKPRASDVELLDVDGEHIEVDFDNSGHRDEADTTRRLPLAADIRTLAANARAPVVGTLYGADDFVLLTVFRRNDRTNATCGAYRRLYVQAQTWSR